MMRKGQRKHVEIYETLRTQILSGALRHGDKLPNEREFAAQHGVATMTLRKALDRLEAEGHLTRRPHHGTYITTPASGRPGEKEFRVGLVVQSDLQTVAHPVFSRFLNGIEGILSHAGVAIEFVISNPANAITEKIFLRTIKESKLDGWIIPAQISEKVRSALKRSRTPKIVLHFDDPELSGHFFETDSQSLGMQIGNHLLESGYRRVAIISVKGLAAVRQKFAASLKAILESAGGDAFFYESEAWGVASGEKACADLLDRGAKIDAMICEDDDIALGVMQALKKRGKASPQIGVIGAGDFPAGVLVEPQLTTISLPYYQVGRDVAQLMTDLLMEQPVEPAHRVFMPKLIVRDSSRRRSLSAKPPIKNHV